MASIVPDWGEDVSSHNESDSAQAHPKKQREKRLFGAFDQCIDEFFSLAESHRAEREAEKRARAGEKKLEAVARDQGARIEALQNLIQSQDTAASVLEERAEEADAALAAVNQCLAQGMEWTDIADLIEAEAAEGNPIAGLIHKLDLSKNRIVLKLDSSIKVDLDLNLSAMSNVEQLHKERKRAQAKEAKTLEASAAAQKAAKLKVERDAVRVSNRSATAGPLSIMRKHLWFEKFRWFLSSEGYIIIAGRDAQQNELVVKRYLWKGGGSNVYVHADLHGAASCVILNNQKDAEVTPKTLNEAGIFCVCHSAAWDAKIVTSAWWVYSHQVSKTAPSGEYLSTGSFLIRGKKNYLPPCPLVMGFGVLFRLDDAAAADRREKRLAAQEVEEEQDEALDNRERASKDTDEAAADGDPYSSAITENENEALLDEDGASDADAEGNESYEYQHRQEDDDDSELRTLDEDGSANADEGDSRAEGEGENRNEREDDISDGDGDGDGDGQEKRDEKTRTTDEEEEEEIKLRKDEPKDPSGVDIDSVLERLNMDRIGIHSSLEAASSSEQPLGRPRPSDSKERDDWQRERGAKDENVKRLTSTRGKKSKAKKIKEKYADQDEEDRALRMAILGSAGTKKSKKSKAKETVHKKVSTDIKEEVTRLGVSTNEEVLEQRRQAIEKEKAAAAAARMQAEQGRDGNVDAADDDDDETVDENNEDFAQAVELRDSLTAVPGTEEECLYALPMCGPYNAMQSFKYKVKLTPGTVKKGKVAKAAVDLFSQMDASASRERELIKKITDPEMVQQIPGMSKLSVAGLSKLKQDSRKQKKKR